MLFKRKKNCDQCGKPAVVMYDDVYLCVDCNLELQQAEQLAHIRRVQQLNLYVDQMAASTGIPREWLGMPRIPIPQSPFQSDKVIFNNINVDRSTIGTINTGTIQRLDTAMTQMHSQGKPDLVETLRQLAEATLESQEIPEAAKNELVEILSFLGEESVTPREHRRLSTTKTVFDTISHLVSTAPTLMELWSQHSPILQKALGVPFIS